MRTFAAKAALLTACSLVLSGCSLLPGDDAPEPTPSSSSRELTSTAWTVAPPAKVERGGNLRLGATAMPRNFNPLHPDAANSDASRILAPTVGGAVRITEHGGWEVDPDYAESVKVTDTDPLRVRVRLNRHAVWQGGTPITAKDMVAFWRAQNGSDKAFEVASSGGYDNIEDVEPGRDRFDYTVTFKRPDAEWPLYVYPHLPANVSSSPKLFNRGFRTRAISSNGPFVVTSIDARKGIVVQRPNPRWWGDRPKLARITWRVATPQIQARAYAAGELDAVELQPDTYPIVKDVDNSTIQRASGVEWSQVTLNASSGPLKDTDVRRAVARAIDRGPIAKQAAAPMGAIPSTLGSVILLPGQRGYVDSSASIAHDPREAADLLDKAGWTMDADGIRTRKGKRLALTMPVAAKIPSNVDRAELIVRDLRKVGIDVELKTVPAEKFFEQYVIALDFDLVTFVRRGSAFPIRSAEALFYPVDSSQNFTGLGKERIGKGWRVTIQTLDDKLRLTRVAKLNEWLFADVPIVPLAVTPIVKAVRTGLVNFGAAQFEGPDWTRVGFTK